MSKLSKQALKVDNNTSFPNNNTGYITPAILRTYNENIIDSMVDEIPYGEFTQSVNISIEALNQYTASADQLATGSLLITASAASNVITFTKGDGSQFNVTVADTTDLSSLNAFTASATISLNALNVSSASQQVSIDALNTYTASASTASIVSSITQLNAFSASQLTKDATLATYTGSNDTKWATLGGQSGSWVTESETGSFAYINKDNAWSANQTFTNITAVSASFTYVQTVYETSSVIYSSGSNQFGDASNDIQTLYGSTRIVNELTASGLHYPTADNGAESFIQTDGAGNLSLQYVKTMYQNIRNMETSSIVKGTPLFASGSTGDNVDVYIADAGNPLRMPATLIAGDTSLAAGATGKGIIFGHIEGVDTNSYPAGTEVYVGVGGGWTATRPTGSSTPIQPLGVVTRQGNNGMGIVMTETPYNLPNIQTGYLWVGNGTNQPIAVATSSIITQIDTGSLVTTASFNAYTASNDQKVNSLIAATGSYATTGSNIFVGNQTITGSFSTNGGATIGNTSAQYNSVNIVTSKTNFPGNVYNAFNINTDGDGQWSAGLYVSTYNPFGSEPAMGLYGGGLGNGGTNNVLESYGNLVRVNKNTQISGSLEVSASLKVNGSNVIISSQTGSFATTGSNAFFGNNSFSGAVAFTGSAPTILSSSFSGSIITNLTDIYTDVPPVNQIVTLTSASYASLVTAGTVDPNTLYVVSGSATQTINTGSFATTGSNTFIGNQTISGSLRVTGSVIGSKVGAYDFDSLFYGSQLGGTIANGTFFGYGSTDYSFILGAYAGGFDSELKISADNTGITFGDFNGTSYPSWLKLSTNTGSNPKPIMTRGLEITGSAQGNVVSASITSNTASIDFSLGNYFEVTSSVTPLHLNVTNIKPGTTSTLIVSASASSSILFSPNVAQPSGSAYSGSAGSIDILSLVAFNTSKVNVVSTKALV